MIRWALIQEGGNRDSIAGRASGSGGAPPTLSTDPRGLALALATRASEFDAVLFHSSADSPVDACVEAARAGKHVFLGAGVPNSPLELRHIAEACLSVGVAFSRERPARRRPSVRAVQASVAAGEIGDPVLVRLHRWRSAGSALSSAIDEDLDLALWLLGRAPERVFALGDRSSYVQAHLGFPGGGMALLDISDRLPAGEGYFSLSVIGKRGAAHADDHRNTQLLFTGGDPRALRTSEADAGFFADWRDFVERLERRDATEMRRVTRESLEVAVVADAIGASLESSRLARLAGGRHELV